MTHAEIIALVPWYVNATLADSERQAVESHVKECAECARSVEDYRRVAAAERELDRGLGEPSPFLFTRTMAAIDAIEQEKGGLWKRIAGWWPATPFPARLVIAAQVMALALLMLWRPDNPYTTLSGPPDGAGAHIQVGFQPAVTEEQIRAAVLSIDGAIVDGPSRLGLYIVRLPASKQAGPALETLRANSTVIRHAEEKR